MESTVTFKASLSEARLLRKVTEARIAHITEQIREGLIHGEARLLAEKERVQLTRILESL
jgi:hypothetical protein